ncbi:MAG: VOC family protein [Sphingobacteriales bacterium]|nr:MAG: VOC family protein [Sphingobacteriales bacterium]
MEQLNLPEGYQTVMPYLIIPNAAGFLQFTKDVFGATEKMKRMRDEHTLMHGEVQIGGCTIMFAESTTEYPTQPAGLFICVADADATYQKALDAGATSIMPPADQDYGRSSGVKDPHGNTWWITKAK